METVPTRNISTYLVQLLYEEHPKLNGEMLLFELGKRCGNVERLGGKDNLYLFAFTDHVVEYKDDKKVPAQMLLAFPDEGKEKPNFEQSLQQSWGWREAKDVIAVCKTTLLLTELLAQGLNYKTRINLFHNMLESVLSVTSCKAIHWSACQQFVNPLAYLEARKLSSFHPLQFALNVRFFNISTRPGEMLMDTIGLSVLGLPDLQCHFINLDPNKIGSVLYNLAYYIFDNGDIIKDGETIAGISPDDKWKCAHEASLVQPIREVLDINPGEPFAAGNRK